MESSFISVINGDITHIIDYNTNITFLNSPIEISDSNKDISFIDIFNKSKIIKNTIGINKDLIQIEDLNISFYKTLRIPDDNKKYKLPRALGKYNLEINKQNNNISFQMFQKEAMLMNFSGTNDCHYAVKIGLNEKNITSGENWVDGSGLSQNPQNYIICPDQSIINGHIIDNKTNFVKQFVAMSLDDNVKQSDILKFEIYKLHDDNIGVYNGKLKYSLYETPKNLNLINGTKISFAKNSPNINFDLKLSDILNEDDVIIYKKMSLISVHMDNKIYHINCNLTDTVNDIKNKIKQETKTPVTDQILYFSGTILNNDHPLDFYGISNGSILKISPRISIWDKQMDIATHGLIEQEIIKDVYDVKKYNTKNYIKFKVNILNSISYNKVIHESPITVNTYNYYGIPWSKLYDENIKDEIFDSIKKFPGEFSLNNVCSSCLDKNTNLKFIPCNHELCFECLSTIIKHKNDEINKLNKAVTGSAKKSAGEKIIIKCNLCPKETPCEKIFVDSEMIDIDILVSPHNAIDKSNITKISFK